MNLETVRKKIARLRRGGKPRVLDLFAGCGGLSLGFQAAAFDLRAAVEFDPDAARSHGLNFHGGDPKHSQARDIIATRPEDLAAEFESRAGCRRRRCDCRRAALSGICAGGPAEAARDRRASAGVPS